MKYALMIHKQPGYADPQGDEKVAAYKEFDSIAALPEVLVVERLKDPDLTTTVRANAGKVLLTDGPFVDTKEILGGIFLIETADIEGAITIASRMVVADTGLAVEIRPLEE